MDGKQLEKSISAPSLSGSIPVALEYMLLFGIGVIAIILHARLRTPLNMPGHHGLEFMTLLMTGRIASRIRWAGTVSSMGIGFILLFPVFGFNDPFMGINYMFPGILLDILYNPNRTQFKWQLLIMSVFAGLAYLTIPLSRLIIHIASGYPYASFAKHGYVIPLFGFFLFGMAGGFMGTGLTANLLKKFSRK